MVVQKQSRPHSVEIFQTVLRLDVKSTSAFIPSSCICCGNFLHGYVYMANQHDYICVCFQVLSISLSPSLFLFCFLGGHSSDTLASNTQVHIVRWWMKHYGSRTSKRHMGFANSPAIRRLDLGRLQVSKGPAPKTCVKYQDKQGRLKYKGTKHIKATETLC